MVDRAEFTRPPRDRGNDRSKAREVLLDRFGHDLAPGKVIGSACEVGGPRRGVDREGTLAIDAGALRIGWFLGPGWGREGIAYGPYQVGPGFTVVASVVNGLTSSQTSPHTAGKRATLRRWLRTLPHVVWRAPVTKDNLAIGLFRSAIPQATDERWCFVNRADELDKGELVGVSDHTRSRLVPGLANVPYTYVVVVRDDGVVLYAAGPAGTRAVGAHPKLRPLGVVEGSTAPSGALYVGIHQAVLGEVGYKSDTRVSGVRAVVDPSLASWWTTAHLADSLAGCEALDVRAPDVGPAWVAQGLVREASGACGEGEATGCPHEPTGLVRATVVVASTDACVALTFRGGDTGGWRFQIGPDGATLSSSGGHVVRRDGSVRLARGRRHALQVRDDGQAVEAFLDGVLLFDSVVAAEPGDRAGRGVGFALAGDAGSHIARFEAHPRAVEIVAVADAPRPWEGSGEELVDVGAFAGPAGPLDEPAGDGPYRWTRLEGTGVFERTGDGRARVRATREAPNPGRTVYGVPWVETALADVTVTLTPPGTHRGEGHWGLSGLAFWQDADNYLIVHQCLGDTNAAISINSFLRYDGVEEMCEHDCVWTNVTGHVMHGVQMVLRVVFDGLHFLVYTDDELVLSRALTDLHPGVGPLTVHQVGLVANWDWGDDTGSVFSGFTARR